GGERVELPQGDRARVVDDAPPGHVGAVGELPERASHAPGGAGPAEERGHAAVAHDAPPRDAAHEVVDALGEVGHGVASGVPAQDELAEVEVGFHATVRL